METYISILRGINVSGHKSIKMDALRNIYINSGFVNVQTYIQSGNVVFQAEKTKAEELGILISQLISGQLGLEVPVIVMEFTRFRSILSNNPFLKDPSKDISYQHITFLGTEPLPENTGKIIPGNYQNDEFSMGGKCIYLYCPGGYGRTKLNNTFFENKLRVTATTRNLKTSIELLKMAERLHTE